MKSAKQAYIYPIKAEVIGEIPTWILGSLYRIGPGKFEVGENKYNHLFDGLGMVQRYWFQDGNVMFNSQFVHSDTYMKNMTANRITVSEFGTLAFPDPCKSIFNKFSTVFDMGMTDNTNVCVYPVGDELFSATETNVIHRINPQDLSTMGSVRLDKILAIHRATAHQHIDSDTGLVHILGFVNSPPSYAVVTLPPIKKDESKELNGKYDMEKLLTEARIAGKVNARWKLNPSYFHSFGMTENYYILLECPLTIRVIDIFKSMIWNTSFANAMKWWPNEKTKIHIIDKRTGEAIPNTYITDALFTFHHVNAYEEDGHVIIDYCGYEDGSIIIDVYQEHLEKKYEQITHKATPRRLVVPIKIDAQTNEGENLNKLDDVGATAKIIVKGKDGSMTIYCSQEKLSSDTALELPTINYNVYNCKKYRYIYGIDSNHLVKVDTVTKETVRWTSETPYGAVGEAIFISDPKADSSKAADEDFGVLLFPIIFTDNEVDSERYQSLVIVDAKSMKEIARAEFKTVSIPITFHGVFLNDK